MAVYSMAGALVQINISGVFTNIGEVESISGPTGEKTTIDTTALAATASTSVSGLPDYGEITLSVMDNPGDAGNARLLTRFAASNVTDNFKIILPFSGTGNTLAFDGYVRTWAFDGQKNAPGKFSCAIKLSGALTRT